MDDDNEFQDVNEDYANVRMGVAAHPLDPRQGNRGQQGELQSRLADDPAPPAVEVHYPPNYAEVVKEPPDQAVLTVNTSWGKTVQIKQWHWDRLKPDALITLEGKRRSGKTNLLRNMLKAMRRYYPEVYIFTGTKMSQEYKGLVPDRYIFDNLQQFPPDSPQYPGGMDAFLHIWHRQVERVEAMRKRGKNDKNIDVLVIIEDLVANEQSHRGFHDIPLFNRIAYNGRHAHMSLWVTSQNIKAVPPAIKDNTDICVILTATSQRTKETVRESFLDSLHNDEEFDEVTGPLAQIPWASYFIDRRDARRQPLECIYLAVPEKIPKDFVMGEKYFWSEDFQELYRNGFGHLLDMHDWGIEKTTYKLDPSGTAN